MALTQAQRDNIIINSRQMGSSQELTYYKLLKTKELLMGNIEEPFVPWVSKRIYTLSDWADDFARCHFGWRN